MATGIDEGIDVLRGIAGWLRRGGKSKKAASVGTDIAGAGARAVQVPPGSGWRTPVTATRKVRTPTGVQTIRQTPRGPGWVKVDNVSDTATAASRAVDDLIPNAAMSADDAVRLANQRNFWTKGRRRWIGYPLATVELGGRVLNAGQGAPLNSPLLGLLNNLINNRDTPEEYDYNTILEPYATQPLPSNADAFREEFVGLYDDDGNLIQAPRSPYQQATPPNLVEIAQRDAAQAQADLEAYLQGAGLYSRNQAQAVEDAFRAMSQNLLESSGNIYQRGQTTAADIDRLYETLGAEQLATAYGEGLSTPQGDLAGLAAPSGEMATSSDAARTYGGSLANYLGQEAGIESAALEQVAQSQALQGAALAQSLRDYVAMAELDKRYQLGRELSAAERAAATEQAMLEWQMQQQQNDYNAQLAQQLFGFEREDERVRAEEEDVRRRSAATAAWTWTTATGEQKRLLERIVGGKTGQAGLEEFVRMVYENPALLQVVGE
jgi:hypothetical protein